MKLPVFVSGYLFYNYMYWLRPVSYTHLRVEKKVENEVMMGVAVGLRHEKFMACISSHEKTTKRIGLAYFRMQ